MPPPTGIGVLRRDDPTALRDRLALSALAVHGVAMTNAEFDRWFAERTAAQLHQVTPIPFAAMRKWSFAPGTGDLVHDTGRFFSVVGLDVEVDAGPVRSWSQPIIIQPEIGLLGIAVREIDGVLHLLMQAKCEPGNPNGVQLSPTVQATKSNYTGVHRGRGVPYLSHFLSVPPDRVVADALQSEHGAWFYRKRNRNMIVEVGPDVEAGADFCWLTLGQVHRQLHLDHRVNMDARTVLSCLPGGPIMDRGAHTATELLSWITDNQARRDVRTSVVGLGGIPGWQRDEWTISHEEGRYFNVRAVDVTTNSREIASWSQPLIEPLGLGMAALVVKRIGGVRHALMHARVEPGYLDVVELAPTVQATPENYTGRSGNVLNQIREMEERARTGRVLFDTELSEEGGRFYHSRIRYLIVEVGADYPETEPPDYRWMTLPQITWLLQHRHYLNVQARSLIAALRAGVD